MEKDLENTKTALAEQEKRGLEISDPPAFDSEEVEKRINATKESLRKETAGCLDEAVQYMEKVMEQVCEKSFATIPVILRVGFFAMPTIPLLDNVLVLLPSLQTFLFERIVHRGGCEYYVCCVCD